MVELVDTESLVPQEHLLRKVDKAVDFRKLYEIVEPLYSGEDGRPIIRVNRAAKTAMEVFDDILNREKLERADLELINEKIVVFEDHLDICLRNEVVTLLRTAILPEKTSRGI